jgi:type IV secretory pathway VirB4 component
MLEKSKKQNEINIFDNIPSITDILLPDTLQEKNDYLVLGYNKYSRIFVMTIYPEQTWVSWLDDLFYIGNINISVKIEPASSGNVINQLTKKLVQIQSEYATYSRQGNILHLPELEKQIGDLEDLRMLIQTNQDKLFFVTIFISLNAESLEELNEKTKILESELNKKTAMIRTLTFRQLEGLKTMLPTGELPIPNYERNMVAGGVATLIPISNPNLSHDKGIFIGRNMYTNAPVYIDTFVGPPSLPNPHVFICGTSGGGKSVALKTLTARNIATTGCGAFFIDVEGEYTNLTKMLGGKVIKIEQGKSTGINPFELEPDIKGTKQFLNILDKVAEIRALIGTICRNYQGRTLNGTEITEIEIVVNQLYAEKGITSDVNSLYEKKRWQT